ncbi:MULTISPECIES: nucleotidyltransferase [Clostridium]|uniref:tRNA(Met) cytidine acetate ligase n=1 Tax=Clostridium cibarium TaxID=2762247 RepID=A0ABR8PQF9_9CLOT|nr:MULTISPECIES: nucleotidyltransferase [Clostridium]MBD7910415.1 nucleotidyltransferase [Clostridium cibarium]
MNITGIITEYNPFHLGHLHHLKSAKNDTGCDGVICIMSGNFMQRGIPAITDKWSRAEMAVKNGVDLVIELPLVYSISSAEAFAEGAIKILNKTGVIRNVYFGSEHGRIEDLELIAHTLLREPEAFKLKLKEELKKGLPFHTARSLALNIFLPSVPCSEILSNSNNILAIEYIKALKKIDSTIVPKTLKRIGSNYNDTEINSNYPSATSIRACLHESKDLSKLKTLLPEASYSILDKLVKKNYKFVEGNDIFSFLKYKILTEGEKINKVFGVKEGLENKILKEISNAKNLNELILKIKSKRYTYTRINRILISFFIGLDNYNYEDLIKENTNYIRPLAFNTTGSKILKEIKKKNQISIITKVPKNINDTKLEIDLLGTKAFSILNDSISPYDDYYKSPIFLK